jgi:hypothetical protein
MAVTVLPLHFNPDFLATGDLATFFTTTGSPTVSATNGRNGTSSIRIVTSGATGATVKYGFSSMSTISWNAAIRINRLPTTGSLVLAEFIDASITHLTLLLLTTGMVQIMRGVPGTGTILGTAVTPLLTGVHEHLECKATIHNSTGTIQIWKNEALLTGLNLINQDTQNAGNASCDAVRWGIGPATGIEPATTIDYSDIHIANDQVGDKRVVWILPNAAGTYTDFALTGAATNREAVDDATQDGDTSYVSSATIGDQDSYGLTNIATGPAIFAASAVYCSKKTDAGTRKFKPLYRIGGTDYLGTEVSPGTTYSYSLDTKLVSPATAVAYTVAELNGMELGQEVTA